jgi:ATP-dependent Clp protease ATP-binding subunit ClpA
VGYEEGGQLTEAVRRHPYSVVLFDEIEKAHPDVFNMLLQVLDDGRLTDNKGRTVDFKNTVVIMTSNVGAELIPDAETMEKDYDAVEKRLMGALRQTFRPEFLNRIDETIVFHGLGREELEQITDLLLTHVRRLVEAQGMRLEVSEEARRFVAAAGYDPQFGARPLKRAIQRLIENPLSRELLGGSFALGDTIRVGVAGGSLVFER